MSAPPAHAEPAPGAPTGAHDLVVVSLEPWDEVWRRNQHLVAGLLHADPALRVLFVEPPQDPVHDLRRRAPARAGHGARRLGPADGAPPGRLWTYQQTKWLPRRLDPHGDERRARAVRAAAARLGMTDPVLWVNDPAGAVLLRTTGWTGLYDITDDWLQAARGDRELGRLAACERELLAGCAEVVVCSAELARTKGTDRPVTLVPNAVDVLRYRTPAPRPADLPDGPYAVYVGTVHADRVDVGLCVDTAARLAPVGARLVLVGPALLEPSARAALDAAGVLVLGARPAATVPGYLQHAAVLVVPHVVDAFTDTLDPIKLYEYLAVDRPVVSTSVAGFRDLPTDRATVAGAEAFPAAVAAALTAEPAAQGGTRTPWPVPDWSDRVAQMSEVLTAARAARPAPTPR